MEVRAFPGKEEHNEKEKNSLKKHFEEGAREVCDAIFYHPKRSIIWGISRKFPINIISDSSESDSNWNDNSETIGYRKEGFFIFFCVEKHCSNNSDESSVKAHASFPEGEYLGRMFEVVFEIIKKNISDSSS